MTSVLMPSNGGTVSFRYDPFEPKIYKSSPCETAINAYEGDNLIEETSMSVSLSVSPSRKDRRSARRSARRL
jgi:hypothetical protein